MTQQLRLTPEQFEQLLQAVRMAATPSLVPLLLTKEQVAAILNVSDRTVTRMVAAGNLKPVRVGGVQAKRYRRRDIESLANTGWHWPKE